MTIDKKNKKHIIADEGMVLRRKSDKQVFGLEVYLGLNKGIQEKPEDFEEISDISTDNLYENNLTYNEDEIL